MKRWLLNILIAIDQLVNAVCGGDPDETISSRCGKVVKKSRFAYWLCRFLNLLDPRHSERSIEADECKNAVLK
jgi:hypothetical protein